MQEPAITTDIIAAHGLNPEEYARILDIIRRDPTFTELGIFSAMWNEHCSYKSSKKWLRTLPTTGPQVICGPGENAGIVDIGDGQALSSRWKATTTPPISSLIKVLRRVWAASCAMSSPWARGPSRR